MMSAGVKKVVQFGVLSLPFLLSFIAFHVTATHEHLLGQILKKRSQTAFGNHVSLQNDSDVSK
jgi:hypothetical protein